MRLSRLAFATLREAPKDAEAVSHRLMVRASLIRQVAAGIYEWLPLGWRTVLKTVAIVREEMDRAGAQEVLLPQLSPRELWEESGRWSQYGKELMRVKDRNERDFALGPTHEEVITDLARALLRSYRKMGVTLYQIQTKFRDDLRPRFGVMRAREFTMKDAYSFDADDAGAERSFAVQRDAYNRIFTRLGLRYRMVDADSGLIGGEFSNEFMVLASTGEAAIASCGSCDYAANTEKAEPGPAGPPPEAKAEAAPREVSTPGTKSVNAVAKLLAVPPGCIAKLLFYVADGKLIGVLLRGDHELNEIKLANHLGETEPRLAKAEEITAELGVPLGYIGPVGLKPVRVIVDRDLAAMPSIVTGANKPDAHLAGVKPGRDFAITETAQVRSAREGDACPHCGGKLSISRGIEVGHIFKLGTKYSKAMKAVYQDEEGKEREMVMGCYGIGVTRIVAAAIEQNHDDKGIIWPEAIAPYRVIVVPVGVDAGVTAAAETLYAELTVAGVDALLDDRADAAPGVKFNDADLLGIPWQVIVGRTFTAEGKVELKRRGSKDSEKLAPIELVRRFNASAGVEG